MAAERILVVDDEKGVVRSCVRILERQGFTVLGRTDSQSVPELLKQESFDLLLTDIKMPRIDGLELLRTAKSIDPNLTVVLITGYGTMEDAINAIRLGAEGFIMKPFEPADLLTTIRDNLARRALIRDSLRLQTLLPLLEINQTLQFSGGEASLIRKILEIARQETGAARIAWYSCSCQPNSSTADSGDDGSGKLVIMAVVPENSTDGEVEDSRSWLPKEALSTAQSQVHPVWLRADGTFAENMSAQPNITGAVLPLTIKGELVGLLTAEIGEAGRSGPFDPISLDLLSVLAGQLAIIIENVQLFQQTEALRAFNEDIIQNMTNGLIAIDSGRLITAFNPAAARMLGYSAAQILNQPIEQIFDEAKKLVQVFDQTLVSGNGFRRLEMSLPQRDDSHLPISISTAPLFTGNAGDEPIGVVGVLEDLSEIKALEAERRRLDRLAALGEMAAVVAHEIRNPIAGISAGIEFLTRNISKESPDSTGVKMIQGEIERVNRILEDILFVARPLQLTLSSENLSGIIEEVIQRCQPQLQQNQIAVSFNRDENLPLLRVDRQRMEQVFTNLVLNATQAMLNGGQILLETAVIATHNRKEANEIIVTIADTGPGIPFNTQKRIFEPFFTTKARGTGLGLPVARRIIEEHGGTINIESEEGKGARFTIELPIQG